MVQTWEIGRWQIAIDMVTGYIKSIADRVSGAYVMNTSMPLLTFTIDGKTPENVGCYHKVEESHLIGLSPTLKSIDVTDLGSSAKIHITYTEAAWEWFSTIVVDGNAPSITCNFGIKLADGPPHLLRDAWVEWRQPVTSEQNAVYAEPGYPPKSGMAAKAYRVWEQMSDGRCGSSSVNQLRDCPAFYPGVFVLWDEQAQMNWTSWWFSPQVPATAECQKHGNELRRRYRLYCCSRMHAGKCLTFGSLYFRGYPAPQHDCAVDLSSFWESVGKGTDAQRQELVASTSIYEVYVGEKAGRTCYPAMSDITADLPRIKALGCNTIQLMPQMPMPAYRGVISYFDPAFNFGGAQELRELIMAAHSMGMHVILDIVLHGSPTLDEETGLKKWSGPPPIYRTIHPDWFIRHEDGRISHAHNDAFDLANPDFQDHVASALYWYVQAYGVDGFRIDAQNWNFFPNWDPGIAPREAYGNFYGAYALIGKVRAKLHASGSDAFIYTEWGGPINYGLYDTTYNYDESWIPAAIFPVLDPRGEASYDPGLAETLTWPELALWLKQRQSVFPRHALKIHHLDSHDTHEWKGLNQFRSEAFGNSAAQALFALMALLDGGLLIFTGAETGNEDFYRWILALRTRARIGERDYTAAQCPTDDRLVTLLWTAGGRKGAVILVNLSDKPTEAKVIVDLDQVGMDKCTYQCTREQFIDGEIVKDELEHHRSLMAQADGTLLITVGILAYGVAICWLYGAPA